MKLLKPFLEEKYFDDLQSFMLSNNFPWYYNNAVGIRGDNDFMFFHLFYAQNKILTTNEIFNSIINPILVKLNITEDRLIRVKANCYTKQVEKIEHSFHIDNKEKHKVCLLSINDNNGYTEFENGDKVKSVSNRAVIFNGKLKHRSVTQSDEHLRVNININYK